jgi:prolyl oligopeptidase PreP (S9A serine peptidase family)
MYHSLIAIFFSLSFSSFASDAAQSYLWLENPSDARQEFIAQQNTRTYAKLRHSDQFEQMGKLFPLDKESNGELASATLANGDVISMNGMQIMKPQAVTLKKADGTQEELFTNYRWRTNNTFVFLGMSVSPGERYLFVSGTEDGAINGYLNAIYDLKTKTFVEENLFGGLHQFVAWIDENTFLQQGNDFITTTYRIENSHLSVLNRMQGELADSSANGTAFILDGQTKHQYLIRANRPTLVFQNRSLQSIVDETPAANGKPLTTYMQEKTKDGFGQIVKIEWPSNVTQQTTPTVIIPNQKMVMKSVTKNGDDYFVHLALGFDHKLRIFELAEKNTFNIDLPINGSFRRASWIKRNELLKITLGNRIIASQSFTYDLKQQKFLEGDVNDLMTKSKGLEFIIENISYPSADGTMIPMQITRLKNLKLDGTNPSYSEVYGGFGSSSGLDPYYYSENLFQFAKNGGVLAFPGVRGGADFGEAWHQPFVKGNRQKVIDDIHGMATYLIAHKYVEASKIVLLGYSNGGNVITVAGLQRPELYGTIIPVSGVHDYLNHQRIDILCQENCLNEYGDGRLAKDRKYMVNFSTIELVKKLPKNAKLPNFFIVNGQNDNRISPSHSYKFTQALIDQGIDPDRFILYSVPRTGHFVDVSSYTNVLGWFTSNLIWAQVLSATGVNFF